MSAKLKGTAGLGVEPKGLIRKRISDVVHTIWQWEVWPNKKGTHLMQMSVYIHIDETIPYTVKEFENTFEIKMTDWEEITDYIVEINLVWAFVTGAVRLFWGGYMFIRGRKWKQPKKSSWLPFSKRASSIRTNRTVRGGDE